MTTYTPVLHDIPTGLDEVGYELGLPRLPLESGAAYRERLLAFTRKGKSTSEAWYASVASILLGLSNTEVFTIDVVVDGDGVPVATEPRVEITASRLRAWEDYTNDVLELDLDLLVEYKFLSDLETAINASASFTATNLLAANDYLLSSRLRVSSSDGWTQQLLSPKKVHVFKHPYIAEIYPDAIRVFETEVATEAEVTEYGTYYLDRVNGVVKTYEPMAGVCSFSYWNFPMPVWHDAVRVTSIADADLKYTLQHQGLSDLGEVVPLGVPNDLGALVYNELLRVYPSEWGS
jgi:hypothetical protein